jgi:hypothetical protein
MKPLVTSAMDRLRADLESGSWARKHRELFETDHMDYGFRLLATG